MEDRKFDSLARSLAAGANRRTVLKSLLGLGGAAVTGGMLRDDAADAARRPTPTPKPVTCPGRQTWNGSQCVCPGSAPYKCGPDCCTGDADDPPSPTHSECCDNACCFGTCYGEELCCPTNWRPGEQPPTHQVCISASGVECCPYDDRCCEVDGCCDTVCWGGQDGISNCCPQEAYCPGNDSPDVCCTNDFICCGAGTSGNLCRDPNVEGGCCTTEDCPAGQICEDNLCVTPCTTEVRIQVELHDGGASDICPAESSNLATEVGLYPYDGETGCGTTAIATASSTAEGPAVFLNVPAGLYCPLPTDPAIRGCVDCPSFGEGIFIHVTSDPCEMMSMWAIGVARCCVEGVTVPVFVHAPTNGCSQGPVLVGVPIALYDCERDELLYGPVSSNNEGYANITSVLPGTYCARAYAESSYSGCERCPLFSEFTVICPNSPFPALAICAQGETCEEGTCVVDDPNAPCQPGYFRNEGTCTPCAGGFAGADGLTCERCGPGTYAPAGSAACLPCEPGHYTDDSENDECNVCPPGWFATDSGSDTCTPCPLGTYSSEEASIVCSPCSAGTFTEHVGQTICIACTCQGTCDATSGQCVVPVCDSGYAPNGSGVCAPCGLGSYSTDGTVCAPCGLGTYQDLIGQSACPPCALGSYAASVGQSACNACACGATCNPTTGQCPGGLPAYSECQVDSECESLNCGCGSPPGFPECFCRFADCWAEGVACGSGAGAVSCCEGDCLCHAGGCFCTAG